MGQKSYLSAREKLELIDFLAATGENYERYKEWAEQRGVKPFSQKYLHTWIQRRRYKFQQAREKHKEEVRRMSMYTRERRIEELEKDLELLKFQLINDTHNCTKCGALHGIKPDDIIKITEARRKISEAIAKERNEWLKPETSEGSELSTRDRIRSKLTEMLESGTKTTIIDG